MLKKEGRKRQRGRHWPREKPHLASGKFKTNSDSQIVSWPMFSWRHSSVKTSFLFPGCHHHDNHFQLLFSSSFGHVMPSCLFLCSMLAGSMSHPGSSTQVSSVSHSGSELSHWYLQPSGANKQHLILAQNAAQHRWKWHALQLPQSGVWIPVLSFISFETVARWLDFFKALVPSVKWEYRFLCYTELNEMACKI